VITTLMAQLEGSLSVVAASSSATTRGLSVVHKGRSYVRGDHDSAEAD